MLSLVQTIAFRFPTALLREEALVILLPVVSVLTLDVDNGVRAKAAEVIHRACEQRRCGRGGADAAAVDVGPRAGAAPDRPPRSRRLGADARAHLRRRRPRRRSRQRPRRVPRWRRPRATRTSCAAGKCRLRPGNVRPRPGARLRIRCSRTACRRLSTTCTWLPRGAAAGVRAAAAVAAVTTTLGSRVPHANDVVVLAVRSPVLPLPSVLYSLTLPHTSSNK